MRRKGTPGNDDRSENVPRRCGSARRRLVHEALFPSAVDRLAAGVRTLVLSHLIPAEDPLVSEASWIEAARTHFSGRIIVGTDLMEIGAD
ncbi:MAG: hypothetical protein ABI639_02430 [Thermoanaerobaculia bacterium]